MAWVGAHAPHELFTTAITEAEIFYGANLHAAGKRRDALLLPAEAIFAEDFAERILPFDSAAARVYSEIATRRRAMGRPIHHPDA